MKKNLLLIALLTFSFKALAWDAPEVLQEACYGGCTEKMEKMYEDFLNTPYAPKFVPGMYAGECNHQSGSYDPDTTHYVGLLLNKHEKVGTYMSPILQYFGEGNDMASWSLEDGIKNMSTDWRDKGIHKVHPTSLTSAFLDNEGYPALVYWARQNPATKEVLFLAWLRGNIAFCRLTPNVNGLP